MTELTHFKARGKNIHLTFLKSETYFDLPYRLKVQFISVNTYKRQKNCKGILKPKENKLEGKNKQTDQRETLRESIAVLEENMFPSSVQRYDGITVLTGLFTIS